MADLTIIPRDAPRTATADRGRLGRLFNGGERYLPGQRKEAAGAYLFIGPTILLLALFYFIPLIQTFYYSFTHWNPFSVERAAGAGLSNYRSLVTTAQFLSSLGHTLIYIVFTVPIGMGVGLILALLLHNPFRGRALYRTLVFIPYIAPIVGSAFVFDFVVSPLGGVADGVLQSLGLPQVNFLNQDPWAMISIIAFSVWQIAGFNMVIYLAALGAVPDMYYEAGLIDGASAFQRFRSITWPLIWPSTLFLMMIGVVNSIQMFTQGYILTQGGPLTSTQVIMEWIYQQSFVSLNGGLATAGSVVLFLIGMILTLLQLRFLGRRYAVNLG